MNIKIIVSLLNFCSNCVSVIVYMGYEEKEGAAHLFQLNLEALPHLDKNKEEKQRHDNKGNCNPAAGDEILLADMKVQTLRQRDFK